MKINTNIPTGDPLAAAPAKPSQPAIQTDAPITSFSKAVALEQSLMNISDVRPEAVSRAKALLSNPNYPASPLVKQLANFLAVQLTSSESNEN